MVPSRSSCHLRSFVPAKLPDWEREIHLTQLFRFPEPPLISAGSQAELKKVEHSFCRDEFGIEKVDTPSEIKDFLMGNLSLGRVFEIEQIEEILDDKRFIFGRKARLLEHMAAVRRRLQSPEILNDDKKMKLKDEIASLLNSKSMLLRAVSAESVKIGDLIDRFLEDDQDEVVA